MGPIAVGSRTSPGSSASRSWWSSWVGWTTCRRSGAVCSVAVVPSHEGIESFGLVAIEAMATGVPVVATRNGGLVEVVGEDGESGTLVQPGSPPELAAAISGLLRDEDLRNAQGRSGRRRVERLYSLDACADSYAKLIGSVLRAREAAA